MTSHKNTTIRYSGPLLMSNPGRRGRAEAAGLLQGALDVVLRADRLQLAQVVVEVLLAADDGLWVVDLGFDVMPLSGLIRGLQI